MNVFIKKLIRICADKWTITHSYWRTTWPDLVHKRSTNANQRIYVWVKCTQHNLYLTHVSIKYSIDKWTVMLGQHSVLLSWAFHISWSNAVCLCVWVLASVAQIVNAAHRDMWSCTLRPTNEYWYMQKKPVQPDLLYSVLGHHKNTYMCIISTR